jgi:hypothetical protein
MTSTTTLEGRSRSDPALTAFITADEVLAYVGLTGEHRGGRQGRGRPR